MDGTLNILSWDEETIQASMLELGKAARLAAKRLALSPVSKRNEALICTANFIKEHQTTILKANELDLEQARQKNLAASFIDRLALSPERLTAITSSLQHIASLPDPLNRILSQWEQPNGLVIQRISTPIGVIGVIFESRPNVVIDAAALCLKSGNVAILRSGSASFHSAQALFAALHHGLQQAELPLDSIALVPTQSRAAVGAMLTGLAGTIDVIVPRGGKSLVGRVQSDARVPVFAHLEGIVHLYIDASADLNMAKSLLLNSKLRRTGICGAAETLLIDQSCAASHHRPLVQALLEQQCRVFGDLATQKLDSRVKPATEEDWRTEYLDAIISVKLVANLDQAIEHINHYGSHHTDAIVTQDQSRADRFLREIDSAIVLHNASTQFADGGEFGFGGEIGIATGRMHARGPVGVEQLTSFNYRVHGRGQLRP